MIYYFRETGTDNVKVGHTDKGMKARLDHAQIYNPRKLEVLAVNRGTRNTETQLHDLLWQRHIRGEWFLLSYDEVMLIAGDILTNPGPPPVMKFTSMLEMKKRAVSLKARRWLSENSAESGDFEERAWDFYREMEHSVKSLDKFAFRSCVKFFEQITKEWAARNDEYHKGSKDGKDTALELPNMVVAKMVGERPFQRTVSSNNVNELDFSDIEAFFPEDAKAVADVELWIGEGVFSRKKVE